MKNETDIRAMRLKLGLSQEQLADHFGVKHPTISRWETGKVKPKPYVFAALKALRKPRKRAAK